MAVSSIFMVFLIGSVFIKVSGTKSLFNGSVSIISPLLSNSSSSSGGVISFRLDSENNTKKTKKANKGIVAVNPTVGILLNINKIKISRRANVVIPIMK
ncbi:MAG: hypothetical protein AB1567_07660 [bacterium]